MEQVKSDIPIDYITIKITKARIEKGLLAIPVSLIHIFPKQKGSIIIDAGNGRLEKKTYTPYTSSSRECRIGGLREFYTKYAVEPNDELVIQKINDDTFKIIHEKEFKKKIISSLYDFENSKNEVEVEENLEKTSKLSNIDKHTILCNEFIKISKQKILPRKTEHKSSSSVREAVPLSMRKILVDIYKGKCQISDFSFLMKNGKPYFEIHHINPLEGNHFKNLLVVSPNVHAQFTYANVEQSFDDDGWLRSVKFNDEYFSVFQIIDTLPKDFKKEIHFV